MSHPVEKGDDAFYVLKRPAVLGEGNIYREEDATLHYVDCLLDPPQLHILSIDPKTGGAAKPSPTTLVTTSVDAKNTSIDGLRVIELADSVTMMAFRSKTPKSYICLYYQGIAFMDEETGKLDVLKEIIPTSERSIRRFNDGGVDAKGRFWGAEIDVSALRRGIGRCYDEKPIGRLWRYDPDGTLTQMADELVCGNGLGWSPDNKTFYLNDSAGQRMYAFDFDLESGSISNRRVFYDFSHNEFEPDGMVVDTAGNLWVAMYNGNGVYVFSPDGKILKQVKFPAKAIACTTWGGENNDIIYGVSAYNGLPNDQGGHLFKYHSNVKGLAKHRFGG